tara:strand:+ start:200 stop:421 length:222 start_codon:yes stop_codon:yes gene_type:complete
MDWIAGFLELCGGWCIGYKKKLGFIFNVAAAFGWIYVAVDKEVYGLLLVVIPLITINIKNYCLWHKDDILNNR